MRIDQRQWLSYMLLAVAFAGCVVSLCALFQLGSPRWISSINALSIVCVLLAAKLRPRATSAKNESSAHDY
jgi:hypothetical protein